MDVTALFEKFDRITEELHEIKISMATRNQQEIERQKKDSQTMSIIESHRLQIAKHEVMIAQINTKIMIFGVTAVTLIPVLAALVLKFLEK